MTGALEMLRAIQSRSARTSMPPDLVPTPFLDASGGLIIPFRSPARYRWWDERLAPPERLSVCSILHELGAGPEVHRAHCGAGPCSVRARDGATGTAVPERTEPLKPGGHR